MFGLICLIIREVLGSKNLSRSARLDDVTPEETSSFVFCGFSSHVVTRSRERRGDTRLSVLQASDMSYLVYVVADCCTRPNRLFCAREFPLVFTCRCNVRCGGEAIT